MFYFYFYMNSCVLLFALLFRAPISSKKSDLTNQWHCSLLAMDASNQHRRKKRHHLQRSVPTMWWWWRWCEPMWAMWTRPEIYPPTARYNRYLCGDTGLCDAYQLYLPRWSCEWRLWTGCGSAITGKCYRQCTPSGWVSCCRKIA